MAFVTWEDTTSNGSQTDYTIIFPFLSRDHVEVKFSGVAQPSTAFSFLSDTQIRLTTAAPNGTVVRVGRNTPKTVITDFEGGVILPEANLDAGYLQMLYHNQELQDLYDEAVASAISVQVSPLNNLVATVPPSITDDTSASYQVGSFWYDSVNKVTYRASDVTEGAAVWSVVGRKSNVSAVSPSASDDEASGYAIGDHWWDTATGTIYTCTDASEGAAVWGSLAPSSISYPLTHTGLVYDKKSSGIASAATTDLSTATGNYVEITGSTGPITSFGTLPAGTEIILKFASTPTITHHATKIQMPADTSRTMAAGDIMFLRSDGADAWTVTNIVPHTGLAITPQAVDGRTTLETFTGTTVANIDLTSLQTKYSGYRHLMLEFISLNPVTDDVELEMLLDYGAGFLTTGYAGVVTTRTESGVILDTWGGTEALICGDSAAGFGIGNLANESIFSGYVHIKAANDNTVWTPIIIEDMVFRNGQWNRSYGQGGQETNGSVDGIRLQLSSGNIAFAFGVLYGIL